MRIFKYPIVSKEGVKKSDSAVVKTAEPAKREPQTFVSVIVFSSASKALESNRVKKGRAVTTYYQEPRPARQIPTKKQMQAAIRRKEVTPGEQNPRTRANISVPVQNTDYELEEDDSYYVTRPHSSVRRYDTTAGDVQIIRQGKRQFVIHDEVPPVKQRQVPPTNTPQRNMHPLVWIGAVLSMMIIGFFVFSTVSGFVQAKQEDLKFGQQRHFTINAVVGHNDSTTSPSHFTGENNNGDIYVIELPGGNTSKAHIYQITTIPHNTGNPPVSISFQDMNGDGKLDMLVQIGDQDNPITIILLNNGSQFITKL